MTQDALVTCLAKGDWVGAEALLAPIAAAPDADPSVVYNWGKLLIELDRTCKSVAEGCRQELRREWLSLIADRDGLIEVEHNGRQFEGRIIDIDDTDHSLLIQEPNRMIWHLKPNVSRLMV